MDIQELKEDYLTYYVMLVRESRLTQHADVARQKILAFMRHEYAAYKAFFSEQALLDWKQWNNRQSLQTCLPITQLFLKPATKELGTIPANVQAVYQVLDTINFVHDLAQTLEHVDLRPEKHTLTQLMQLIVPIVINLPKAYERLHSLNHSSLYLQQLVAPSTGQLMQAVQQLFVQGDTWKKMLIDAHVENREKLQHLFLDQTDGLALLSRIIIMSSYLIKELTELVERGDLTIDFNPASPEIIHLEQRFNKAFKKIQHADALLQGLGPVGKMADLLYSEITKILQESVPLVRVGVLRADEAVKMLKDEVLGHYRAEVETLEEQLGLMPGLLVEPFEVHRVQFITQFTAYVSKLSHLPEATDKLAKLTQQPMTHAVMFMAMSTVQQGLSNVVSLVLPRQSTEPNATVIEIDFNSTEYQNLLHQHRLRRLAENESVDASEHVHVTAINFFKLLNTYAMQWSGPRRMIDLPPHAKQTLKSLYLPIQTYFARYSPRLDQAIVHGLNHSPVEGAVPFDPVARAYHMAFEWFQQQPRLLQVGLILMGMNPQWFFELSHQLVTQFFYRTLLFVALKQLWDYQQSELLQIAYAQQAVMIEIEQARAQARVTIHTLEMRLQASMTDIQQQPDFQQEKQQVLAVMEQQRQDQAQAAQGELMPLARSPRYQTLLDLIKTMRMSQKLADFEVKTLFPAFRQWLNAKQQRLLLDFQGLPLVPYESVPHSHDALNLYQNMLNSFYHLKMALQTLEALSDDDVPGFWRAWQFLSNPTAISTHGLAAYYELLAMLQQPLVADLVQEGLGHVEQLAVAIPFIQPIIPAIRAATIANSSETFDAYKVWVNEQNHYDALVQQQWLSDEPEMVDETPANELPASPPDESPVFLVWFTAQAHRLEQIRQALCLSTDAEVDQAQLQCQALMSINDFFEQLKNKSKEILNTQKEIEPKHIDAFFAQIKGVLLTNNSTDTQEINDQFASVWHVFDKLKDTLRLLDQLSVIIKETYLQYSEDAYQQLIAVHLVFSFRLLVWADDLEYQLGLKTGRLSRMMQTYIDSLFEPLVALLFQDDKRLLAYLSDPTILDLRVQRERLRLQQAELAIEVQVAGLEEGRLQQQGLPLSVEHDFEQLTPLLDRFVNSTAAQLDDLPEFKQFCLIYQRLQPHLAYINARVFTQKSFLAGIQRHRPDKVARAIQCMLDHREKLNRYYLAQNNGRQDKRMACKIRLLTLNYVERKAHADEAIKKAIHRLLHTLYYPALGEYINLFIQEAGVQLVEDIHDQPELLQKLYEAINHQTIDVFQAHLVQSIQGSLKNHHTSIGKLLQLLKKTHHFDERFSHQRQYALNRYDQTKMDYSLVLKQKPFQPEEYKIYLEVNDGLLFYEVIDPQGQLIRAEVPPDFLSQHCIDLTHGLDQNTLDKQFLPKLLPFIAMTTDAGHTRVKNPCLKEKMAYLGRLNQEDKHFERIQQKLSAKPASGEEHFYHELYDEEVIRLQTLLAFREKKLGKMDRLIDLYEGLNELEKQCFLRPSGLNAQKIQLIKQLKEILANDKKLPQTRLNQVAWLLAEPEHQALLKRTRDATWKAFFTYWSPAFIRWRVREQAILNQLMPVMGPNYFILTTLLAWQQIKASDSELQRDKKREIQHLVAIMQDESIGEPQRLSRLTDYMIQTPCLAILMRQESAWPDVFGVSREAQLRADFFQQLGPFFDIYYTLDQMQHYAEHDVLYKNDEKIQEIKALKALLESTDGTQEQRLQALYARSTSPTSQSIMTKSSDSYVMQCIKTLYTLLTGWKSHESRLQQHMQQHLAFFKPHRSLSDIIKRVKEGPSTSETPPRSNQP